MKYVEVGGARMSAIGLGTWQFGSTEWGYGSEYARGRYQQAPPRNFRRVRRAFSAESRERAQPLISGLGEIGSRLGATHTQVALAWLIKKPNVVAIPGASSVRQLEENVAAADLELSDDDDARLTALALNIET